MKNQRIGKVLVRVLGLAGLAVVLYVNIFTFEKPARPIAMRNACLANLKQIEEAKALWALDNHMTNLDFAPPKGQLYGSTNYIRDEADCPAGGTYRIGALRQHAQCTVAGHSL